MTLDQELAKPDYAGLSDQAAAGAINGKTVAVVGAVTRNQFAVWCAKTGMRAAIEDACAAPGPLRSIALACRDVLQGGADVVDFAVADNVAMLQAWVAAGGCSQGQADELLALATTQQPAHLAAALGCRGDVLASDVANARAGIALDANRWS